MAQVTVKELKARKQIEVTRIDNNFIENEVIIKEFEELASKEGYKILEKNLNKDTCYMEYVLINPNIEDTLSYSIRQDMELVQSILSKQDREVVKYELDEDKAWLYVTVKGRKIYYNLRLNKDYMKKQLQGKLVFRSKDYYFEFTDKENNKLQLFNFDGLKADMIEGNKIVIKEYGLEYIIK